MTSPAVTTHFSCSFPPPPLPPSTIAMLSWLTPRLLSPFVFWKKPSFTSNTGFLSNGPSTLSQERGVDTDFSQDHLSFQPVPLSSPSHSFSIERYSPFIKAVLSPGDVVGEGIPLRGEPLRLVSSHGLFARQFQVVRKLGTGSHSVVYLVREALPSSEDCHIYPFASGSLDLRDSAPIHSESSPRECAIKLISKADLDENEVLTKACIFYLGCVPVPDISPFLCHVPSHHRRPSTNPFLRILILSRCITC